MIIALDGPAGAGKSTVARAAADALGFVYLDTGAMYRGVALAAAARRRDELRISFDEEDRVWLDGRDVTGAIRTREVSEAASRVSTDPAVRAAILEQKRALLHDGRDWVAEGRDIGTVVAPDAELKTFLTAAPEERARRRALELGAPVEQILAELRDRDARDATREHAPLKAAADAVEPGGVDLVTSIPGKKCVNRRVVVLNQLAPAAIAKIDGVLRRAHDVGEQHGREHPIEIRLLRAHGSVEAVDLADHRLPVAQPRKMVRPVELDETSPPVSACRDTGRPRQAPPGCRSGGGRAWERGSKGGQRGCRFRRNDAPRRREPVSRRGWRMQPSASSSNGARRCWAAVRTCAPTGTLRLFVRSARRSRTCLCSPRSSAESRRCR
jgi:CMP/dCMP kinase